MQLKQIIVEDIPQIARWNIELHEDEGSTPMTVDGAETRLRKWLKDESFQPLIISVDGRLVGYLLYQLVPSAPDIRGSVESVYIRQFYIIREALRSGYGMDAIELLTQQVLDGTQPLHLDVKITNPGGQKFWESLAFVAEHIAYTRQSLDSWRGV